MPSFEHPATPDPRERLVKYREFLLERMEHHAGVLDRLAEEVQSIDETLIEMEADKFVKGEN